MALPRPVFLLLRACFELFVFLTTSYCILAYVPFTYQQIHIGGAIPWLSSFALYYPFIFWGAVVVVLTTLMADFKGPGTKYFTWAFAVFLVAVGCGLLIDPILPHLKNDNRSLYWALASLIPLLWLAAIDWFSRRNQIVWGTPGKWEDHRIFRAAWQSALFLSLLYSAIFYVRYQGSTQNPFTFQEGILSLTWTLVYHLLIFISLFVIFYVARALSEIFENRARVELALCVVVLCLLVIPVLKFLMFPQFSFRGPLADFFAVAAGGTFGISFAALSVRLFPCEQKTVDSGLDVLLMPLRWGSALSGAARFIPILVIAGLAFLLAMKASLMDWNYLVQKLSVLFVWAMTFAAFYELAPGRKHEKEFKIAYVVAAAVITLGAYRSLGILQSRYEFPAGPGGISLATVLETYSGYDISFKLAYGALASSQRDRSFYRFLSENTNIPRSTPTVPVEVNLVDHLEMDDSPKPNIFIFVVDSLRRDYLSPYNSRVKFTPQIEAFARESVVMENSMTAYGGTGLSEPSIWVGGLLLHKQYTTPFYPMNALQKLLDAAKYRSYISKDTILNAIVRPSPAIVELDSQVPEREYDFCRSLADLTSKMNANNDPSTPIFAYTQAQNIHISVITREGESVIDGEQYPGFYAPYASRLRRIDGCMGNFVENLKSSGLYDNSIVILTSDHGDSLGENGRWGHSYTIFPEIIRIPLIIHLPSAIQNAMSFTPGNLAFLTDITPSLYYLLGQGPIRRNGIFGRPLFTKTPEEQTLYLRDSYLVASSYGPVYGIIRDNGQSLYVVNAIDYKDYLFDLLPGYSPFSRPITPSIQARDEQFIREQILAINSFYRFDQRR